MPIKQALGRGLSALIPDSSDKSAKQDVPESTMEIPIGKIRPILLNHEKALIRISRKNY